MAINNTQTKIGLSLHKILLKISNTLFLAYFLCLYSAFANTENVTVKSNTIKSDEQLKNKINQIIQRSNIKESELGIYIEGPDLQLDLNGQVKMKPASVTKVATAAAALELFPIGHQFITEIKSNAKIEKSKLSGDICLVGGGDAGFVSESMWYLVNEFYRTDIREISGNIIVDDSFHDKIRFDNSRDQSRVDRAYDAPIGAMTFNWSAVNIFVRAGANSGAASVSADPENAYIIIDNKTKITDQTNLQVSHHGQKNNISETIRVAGTKANDDKEFVAYKAVQNPDLWAGYNLKSFLQQRQISLNGSVLNGKCDSKAKVLAANKSKSIGELTQLMLKYSNNYIAEILTKNLAAYRNKNSGTMESGVREIRNYLVSLGLTEKDFEIYNPSGLSLKNRMTAKGTVTLLQHIKNDLRIYPEFVAGLPILGVDGTLKKRVSNEELKGLVRAKTGHLTGVSSLAGYVANNKKGVYSFAFYHNGNAEKSYDAKLLFEKMAKELTE